MAYEKRLKAVPPQLFTADGSVTGKITVADASLFKVKQEVVITANTLPNLELEVKQVDDKNTLYVGLRSTPIATRVDLSSYLTSLSAAIFANEQKRPSIPEEQVERLTYEEEPVVARRVILVDKLGNKYATDNPLPVQLSDGSINIETLNANLQVQLDHRNNFPNAGDVADSVRVGDGTNELKVNSDGSINVILENSIDEPEIVISEFSQVSSVASSVNTNLLTYTVPVAKKLTLTRIEVGGSNIATYELYINGAISGRKRTWFSGPFTEIFEFTTPTNGFQLVAGDVLQVRVQHSRSDLGDFEARLQGLLIG